MTRTQKQRLVRYSLYGALILVFGLFVVLADWATLRTNFANVEIAKEMFPGVILEAAKNTMVLTFTSFIGGLALGLLIALMKLSSIGPYRWIGSIYVEVFRGLPALLTLFLIGFGIPLAFGTRWGAFLSAIIALSLVTAAYMAETIRAGIQAVPKGQVEAARSLGMSPSWSLVSIVLPQAFRIIIPPLTNEFVLLIKDTSLVFVLGVSVGGRELTKFGRDALSTNANATPLIVAGIMYLIVTIPLTQMVAWLERRQGQAR